MMTPKPRPLRLMQRFSQPKHRYTTHPVDRRARQGGFTIIESLIAIIVVSILLSAISPVIVFSVATRVQARRIELATQAGRTYIDLVKAGQILPPAHTVVMADYVADRAGFKDVAAPNAGALTCGSGVTTYPYCENTSTSSLFCADGDDPVDGCTTDSLKDYVVQAYRSIPSASDTSTSRGYLLGVRVYRADAFSDDEALKTQAESGRQLAVTSGLGDRKSPLFETTTEVTTRDTQFNDLCIRLGCGTTP